ncbi:hypothetical protein [Streptomyces sp. NPDC001774]
MAADLPADADCGFSILLASHARGYPTDRSVVSEGEGGSDFEFLAPAWAFSQVGFGFFPALRTVCDECTIPAGGASELHTALELVKCHGEDTAIAFCAYGRRNLNRLVVHIAEERGEFRGDTVTHLIISMHGLIVP